LQPRGWLAWLTFDPVKITGRIAPGTGKWPATNSADHEFVSLGSRLVLCGAHRAQEFFPPTRRDRRPRL